MPRINRTDFQHRWVENWKRANDIPEDDIVSVREVARRLIEECRGDAAVDLLFCGLGAACSTQDNIRWFLRKLGLVAWQPVLAELVDRLSYLSAAQFCSDGKHFGLQLDSYSWIIVPKLVAGYHLPDL